MLRVGGNGTAAGADTATALQQFNRYRWDRDRISLGASPRQHHLTDKTLSREDAMHQETISIRRARACKTTGRVLTVLVFSTAFLRPDLASGRGFHGGGFHGGGFHGGGFHGGFPGAGFHPGIPGFHGGGFRPYFLASMAVGFTPGCTNLIPARFSQGFMNFMPAASTMVILTDSTDSANSTDLITTAFAVDLLSSPSSAAGGAVDGAGPITITQSGGTADGAGLTTITQTVATTGPDPTPAIGITAPIRQVTTPT